jgi:O-antigen/teichoic acid export membrane protein
MILSNISSNINKNSLWAIAEYAWYPFLLFLSTRYFLEFLGTHKYGTWMFLTAMVASCSILNVGISGAVIKVVSVEAGRDGSSEVIGSIANTALGIAIAAGVLTSLIMMIMLLSVWHGTSLDEANLFATAVAVTVLVFLEYLDIAYSSVLKGGEHFWETARIEILFKTVQMVSALAVVVVWADLVPLYAVLVIVNIARVVTKMMQMKRVYGIRQIRPAFDSFSQLITYAKWGWLHGIGGFMLVTVDRLLVGYKLGPETLAYYSLLLMIPQQMHTLAGAALSVTFPRVSSLLSSNRFLEITKLKSKINRITALGAAIPTFLLVIFPEEIFRLWLGRDLPPDAMTALTPLTLSFFLLCLNIPPYYTLMGMGQVRYVAIVNLAAGVASMAILVFFLETGGLYIAAVSKLVYAAILFVQFYRVNQSMAQAMRRESR